MKMRHHRKARQKTAIYRPRMFMLTRKALRLLLKDSKALFPGNVYPVDTGERTTVRVGLPTVYWRGVK